LADEQDRGSGARTIALLKLIAQSGNMFTLSELSARASMPPSSVHRLLRPLMREGFVERAEGQAYRAGSEFFRVAALVLRQVDAGLLARPILERLWNRWQETCSLCLYKPAQHCAVVVETIQTPNPLRFVLEPFTELSLTWGSLGRAILAALPPADAEAAIRRPGAGPLSGLPPPSRAEMAREVRIVQEQGFAHYRNDRVDVAGVAAPVRRADGTVLGSIGITSPAQRLPPEFVAPMAAAVIAAAKELSELLGYAR
jgi:DNA-binding IclR family transcriptional regulator